MRAPGSARKIQIQIRWSKINIFVSILIKKFKIVCLKSEKYQMENQNLSQKCQFLVEEAKKLEVSLDKSRDNGERLHKESELVIANVNSWVHEQRYIDWTFFLF